MTDLPAAIAALRAERDANASIGHEPVSWFLVDALLAALDAAKPVGSVQTITSLVGETRKFIACAASEIDALPVGTAVYLAPQAPPAQEPVGVNFVVAEGALELLKEQEQ